MVTVWERAAQSVNRMFSSSCQFVALAVSHFGFEGGTLVLTASVPGDCLPFTFCYMTMQLPANGSNGKYWARMHFTGLY